MPKLCTPVILPTVQVNIVPFGTIRIIDSNYNECQLLVADDTEGFAFEFPMNSVISGSIIYEQLTSSPIHL
jgi:hypothetical protein